MANSLPLTTFVVWAPDHEGAPEKRLSVQASHLKAIDVLVKNGTVRAGGAVMTSDSANAAPTDRRIFGSWSLVEAESLEAARKIFENDIYYTADVWDKEKLQILPIMLATPSPPVSS